MKKLVVIILFSLVLLSVRAQNISFESFIQDSRIGLQTGYGVYYLNKNGWGVGTVFQSSIWKPTESTGTNYSFIGLEARVPIQNCSRLKLYFAPKIGLVNKDFLVFLPELQTEYLITNSFGMGVGAGVRMREAAVSFKVFFQPFKKLGS
ncbi:MAG: hypothetical protein AB8B73_12830 [Ekhidna sp.]